MLMTTNPTKLLLVEDNPGDVLLFKKALLNANETGISLSVAQCLEEALEHLKQNTCHIVLLDLMLPDSLGLETFELLHAAHPNIPIIVLSGSYNETMATQVKELGACDFLVKGDIFGAAMTRAIRNAIPGNS